MANRLILRIRSLIISANQVLVDPTYATVVEESVENVKNLYYAQYKVRAVPINTTISFCNRTYPINFRVMDWPL